MNAEYDFLKQRLEAVGIKKGMTLLVHSSFKSLNLKYLTPKDVINAFMDVITSSGNLLFPTLTYKTVNKDNPYYSVTLTPSCVGILPETFRKMDGVIRSLNPIHSVAAWGKDKEDLILSHLDDDITLGINSPFYKMLKYEGKILMLGCGLKPNTFMHLVENLCKVKYRKLTNKITFTIRDYENNIIKKDLLMPESNNYYQMYDRIINILDHNELKKISINGEESFLIDAKQLLLKASLKIKEDEEYFIEWIER